MAKKKKAAASTGSREIRNRAAFHHYHVLEKVEAGIALIGSEVKSIRQGDVSFVDSYVRIRDGEAWLLNLHISGYKNAPSFGHAPDRDRKLLLRRREILKLEKKTELKGLTLVPLRIYFNARGLAKVELGVCRGKQLHDKRQAQKERDTRREMDREISRYGR